MAAHRARETASDKNLNGTDDIRRRESFAVGLGEEIADAQRNGGHKIDQLGEQRRIEIDDTTFGFHLSRHVRAREGNAVNETTEKFGQLLACRRRLTAPDVAAL